MRLSFVPIYKRELRGYFQNPGVYVAMAIFLAAIGVILCISLFRFIQLVENRQRAPQYYGMQTLNFTAEVVVESFWFISIWLLLVIVPLLTMRLFAEEKRSGTFELLATCPVSDWGLVIGKYLAALTVLVILLGLSVAFYAALGAIADVERPVVFSGYLALFLMCLAYAAFGTFASTLTENQIVAGVITFFGLLTFFLIHLLTSSPVGPMNDILSALAMYTHVEKLVQGNIRSEDIVYFLAFTVSFLFLANHVMESRRRRV